MEKPLFRKGILPRFIEKILNIQKICSIKIINGKRVPEFYHGKVFGLFIFLAVYPGLFIIMIKEIGCKSAI